MTEWERKHVFTRIEHWAWITVYALVSLVLIWIAVIV